MGRICRIEVRRSWIAVRGSEGGDCCGVSMGGGGRSWTAFWDWGEVEGGSKLSMSEDTKRFLAVVGSETSVRLNIARLSKHYAIHKDRGKKELT